MSVSLKVAATDREWLADFDRPRDTAGMNLKLNAARNVGLFLGLSALLFAQGASLTAQIPASELPAAGTDTGLEGKYDPENGIAQLIRDKSAEAARSPRRVTSWWSRNEWARGISWT